MYISKINWMENENCYPSEKTIILTTISVGISRAFCHSRNDDFVFMILTWMTHLILEKLRKICPLLMSLKQLIRVCMSIYFDPCISPFVCICSCMWVHAWSLVRSSFWHYETQNLMYLCIVETRHNFMRSGRFCFK